MEELNIQATHSQELCSCLSLPVPIDVSHEFNSTLSVLQAIGVGDYVLDVVPHDERVSQCGFISRDNPYFECIWSRTELLIFVSSDCFRFPYGVGEARECLAGRGHYGSKREDVRGEVEEGGELKSQKEGRGEGI